LVFQWESNCTKSNAYKTQLLQEVGFLVVNYSHLTFRLTIYLPFDRKLPIAFSVTLALKVMSKVVVIGIVLAKPIRIAIIEDHELTRIGLKATFYHREGIEVVGDAANGYQGLELLKTTTPDLAIIDIGLPDIDGIELVQLFRQSQEEHPSLTKILMLTMHKGEDSVMAAFAAGADAYCMKDISMEKLEEAIRSTHAGNPWIDPTIASIVLQQLRDNTSSATIDRDKTIQIKGLAGDYAEIVGSAGLTDREIQILQLIVYGCSNSEIAEQLFVTVGTVKTHVRHILNKLCVDDRTHAAVLGLRGGLIE
jgi:two-component system, NarL family, response regulator LiaR